MKNRSFYIGQLEREGYPNPTEQQAEIYCAIGSKGFKLMKQAGFNLAVAEKYLDIPPKHGSYQRDMTFNQNMIENLVYQRMVEEKGTDAWFKEYIAEFSEEACIVAFARTSERGLMKLMAETQGMKPLDDGTCYREGEDNA